MRAISAENRSGRDGAPGPSRLDAPVRAEGVQLIGEMDASGYREPPALVRRSDGQTLQLTKLLFLILESVDGRRGYDEIAAEVSKKYGRLVSTDNVRALVDSKLRPLGLLMQADGSAPELRRSNPLLALRFKYAVTDPDRTNRITAPFGRLFHPVPVVLVMAMFLAVSWWVLFEKGLASATYQAFDKPALLLLVFVVTVLSAGFHEFGHASAARYGGATPGVMGMGVYLVWPAFYTDVTDSYRLGRGGRLRTDLGGLYFNAIVAVAVVGVWMVSSYDALLLVVVTQILQMVRQLTPLVRFDGYHVLADLTGVPDLFQRIKPTLLGLLPWRWGDPESKVLKPWARAVVTVWVLLVVPLLLICLVLLVLALPRVLGTAWAHLQAQSDTMTASWGEGDLLGVTARILSMIAIAFPVLGIGYILTRLVRQVAVSVWRRTSGRPVQRGIAAVTAGAILAGLAWAWWPDPGTYRPIQPYERGTLVDAVAAARPAPAGLVEGRPGQLQAIWPATTGGDMPTADHPQLAMVLVPRATQDQTVGTGVETDPTTVAESPAEPAAPAWVFPFNRPLAPEEGDNQALAVNTTDGSVMYDVAFALVWVEDDQVLNTNEAYAFASCRNCATVAVGFQVVLVLGQANVVVPQNLSAAVNYNCVQCLTYALATQLVVTLDGPLSDAGMAELTRLWQQIARFGENIEGVPMSELRARLTAYEVQILQILENDPGSSSDPSGSPDSSDSDPGSQNTPVSPIEDPETAAPTSQPSGGSDPEPGPTSSPSEDPTQGDDATEEATPTPTAEPTPSDPEPSPPAPSG